MYKLQALQDVYVSECGALKQKPNSQVISYLASEVQREGCAEKISHLDFSKTFLGRKGILPLLSVFSRCLKLRNIDLSNTGVNDFACAVLSDCLSVHPSVCTLHLRGCYLTGDSLPYLKKLKSAWLSRGNKNPSPLAAAKRRNDETEFEIHIDEGPGILSSAVADLAVIRRSNQADETPAADGRTPATMAMGGSAVTRPKDEKSADLVIDRKHTKEFLHDMLRLQRRLKQESYFTSRLNRRVRMNADNWLVLGVYISSTFSEFPDEAAMIHRRIFPLVNKRLRPHRVHLVPVMFHTMSDEDFRFPMNLCADGARPVHEGRLPGFRKGSAHYHEQETGEARNLLWTAQSARVSEVRELAVRDGCDIFVGLYSQAFDPACHTVDLAALDTTADSASIPTFVYKRQVESVPHGLQHLFDYSASLQFELAEANHRPEQGTGPLPKMDDQLTERKLKLNEWALFRRRVEERVPSYMQHTYDAVYDRVDKDGLARFHVHSSFFETMTQDLFTAALAYRQKRGSGLAPPATVIPHVGFEIPLITKQEWRTGDVKKNPFAHLEHKLGLDDPERQREAHFKKSITAEVLAPPKVASTEDETLPAKTWNCIFGQRGTGRTTQLRAAASKLKEGPNGAANFIATHSVCHGPRTLQGIMVGLLRQLVPSGVPLFDTFPLIDDEESLCKAFCEAIASKASLVPRFTKALWFVIDDDDAVEYGSSFAEAFFEPARRVLLARSMPHEGMFVRILYTSAFRPTVHEDLNVVLTPNWDEVEAADFLVSMLKGIDDLPSSTLQQIKHAAHYTVLQKKHGLRPLYLYLVAREILFWNEEISMVNIVEALPHTTEEVLSISIRSTVPQDLQTVLEAVATSPTPFSASLLRFAVGPYRGTPHCSPSAAKRHWYSARRWGEGLHSPSSSSAPMLILFLANYIHLFRECTRNRNRGLITQRRSNFIDNVWRTPWTFFSRTVMETLSTRPKERKTSIKPPNVWATTLLRAGYLRDQPYALPSIANSFDAVKLLTTPHPTFLMLHSKRFEDLRLALERLLIRVCEVDSDAPITDGPVRVTPHDIKAKVNELRIALQFSPEAALSSSLGMLLEHITYLQRYWSVLVRHPSFLYSCPQCAPQVLRNSIETALNRTNPSVYFRQDSVFSFTQKCYETALLLTSQAQEQSNNPTAASRGTSTAPPAVPSAEDGHLGPKLQTILKPSVVSKSFVLSYRGIVNAKPHEITPLMASPQTLLAAEEDPNGGASFGYIGAIVFASEKGTKSASDYGFSGKTPTQQPLAKGCYFLSIKAHTNAISCVNIVESKFATRFASAAYYDQEIVIAALVISEVNPAGSKLQLVGRLTMENVQRPMVEAIALSPIGRTQVSDGSDDGQRCPMACVAHKNMLHVYEGQRFGHDNLYNRKGVISGQVFSGHDNRIVHYGFSPAGTKIFSIDAGGHCIVWGSPESPCSGTILGVTDVSSSPTFARFVDHETILLVSNRGITLWNSANSQVQQVFANPTKFALDTNYAMLHYLPPAYIYGSAEDTELLQLPPHVKVHRLLEQLREKKHPTVTYMSFDGITLYDAADRSVKVYRRHHIPPQSEVDCDLPPPIVFGREPAQVCTVLTEVSNSDFVGNVQPETWKWFFGSKMAIAIDLKEQIVKGFDLMRGEQIPLFFAVCGSDVPVTGFAELDDAVLCGENEDRVVVAQKDGTMHVVTITKGPLTYPTPPFTTV